jgi:hypothetical protein
LGEKQMAKTFEVQPSVRGIAERAIVKIESVYINARCHFQLLALFKMMWNWRTPFG